MATVTITIELSEEHAEALAQFCKRSLFSTFRDLSQTADEAFLMIKALDVIQYHLNDAGYNPQ